MVGIMEIPTRYIQRVAGYEARSGVQSQGSPREGSVFYASKCQNSTPKIDERHFVPQEQSVLDETPTAYIRRVNAENGIGAKVAPQPTNSIDDRVERELKVFERALKVLTGGRTAQERIKELKEEEQAYSVTHHIYELIKTF